MTKSSKYIGVCFNKQNGKWQAYITRFGENVHLGFFGNETKAALARDIAAIEYRGRGTKLNFPEMFDV